jgi:hypothetical protein
MGRIEKLKQKEKEIAAEIYAIESGIEGLKPVADGIINIEDYVNAKYKILWILKEVHDDWVVNKNGKRQCGGWNLTCAGEDQPEGLYARIMNKPKSIYNFVAPRRIMLASYCIFEGTTDVIQNRDESKMFKALSSVAYINIKKIPGGSKAIEKQLKEAVENKKNMAILQKQIETYNPDIIICGHTLEFFSPTSSILKRDVKDKKTFCSNPDSRLCYYPLDKLYINTNHPSHKAQDKEFWHERIREIVNAVKDWNIKRLK